MLFDVPILADWKKIGKYRQRQTEKNNNASIDWDYQPVNNLLLLKDGILQKSESGYESDPCTITSVHMNGTIRVQLNIRRVTPYFDL